MTCGSTSTEYFGAACVVPLCCDSKRPVIIDICVSAWCCAAEPPHGHPAAAVHATAPPTDQAAADSNVRPDTRASDGSAGAADQGGVLHSGTGSSVCPASVSEREEGCEHSAGDGGLSSESGAHGASDPSGSHLHSVATSGLMELTCPPHDQLRGAPSSAQASSALSSSAVVCPLTGALPALAAGAAAEHARGCGSEARRSAGAGGSVCITTNPCFTEGVSGGGEATGEGAEDGSACSLTAVQTRWLGQLELSEHASLGGHGGTEALEDSDVLSALMASPHVSVPFSGTLDSQFALSAGLVRSPLRASRGGGPLPGAPAFDALVEEVGWKAVLARGGGGRGLGEGASCGIAARGDMKPKGHALGCDAGGPTRMQGNKIAQGLPGRGPGKADGCGLTGCEGGTAYGCDVGGATCADGVKRGGEPGGAGSMSDMGDNEVLARVQISVGGGHDEHDLDAVSERKRGWGFGGFGKWFLSPMGCMTATKCQE